MVKTWEQAFDLVEETYGVYTDEEEGFFYCPECDEPIYGCDWEDVRDFTTCPICGFNFVTGECAPIEEEEDEEDYWDEEEDSE